MGYKKGSGVADDADIVMAQRCFAFDEPLPADASQDAALEHIVCNVNASHGREVWFSWRDEALAFWRKHHPGRRPSPWWEYESGLGEPPLKMLDGREVVRNLREQRYETQTSYLARHNLLTAAERKVLPPQALVGVAELREVPTKKEDDHD